MKALAHILILLFTVIVLYIGFVAYDNDRLYFLGEQAKELCLLLAACTMCKRLNWHWLFMFTAILSILSFGELIDEIRGRNTTVFYNDYIFLTVAAISCIYLSYITWQKSKKNS